ncbi:MAG: radical SAM protein [Candidatus Falkowbacteria bacterium]
MKKRIQGKRKIKLVFLRTLYSQSGASLTMGNLASYLRKRGFDAVLCFLERNDLHAAEKILTGGADMIIAKPNFKDYRDLLPLLKEIRLQNRTERVFLCGPFAVLNAEGIMAENEWLDGVITGALEETAADLLRSLCAGKPDPDMAGGVWRLFGEITRKKVRPAAISFNDMPPPARDIEEKEAVRYANVEASRGCPHRCSFCHNPLMTRFNRPRGRVEVRSPEKVVDEIEYLNKKLGKSLFIFNDDCFWRGPADDRRILNFCREIKKRRLRIKYYVYLRCDPFVGAKVLKAMRETGLVRVFLGLENVAAGTQKKFNKGFVPDKFREVKSTLEKNGINYHIGYIVFEPYSNLRDIRKNIDYLHGLGKLFRLGILIEPVRIIPGSDLHARLVEDGLARARQHYSRVTYGYRFRYPATAVLFRSVRRVFCEKLGPISYKYEYYCTAGGLLKALAEKENADLGAALEENYGAFEAARRKSMEIIHEYLKNLLARARSGGRDPGKERREDQEFAAVFEKAAMSLALLYAEMAAAVIARGGQRVVDEVYTGLDRL